MVPMTTGAQPAGPPPESVVEFGVEPGEPREGRTRSNASGIIAGLAADRRTVPLAATVGAVALFGSLVSEWQVTSVDLTAFGGVRSGNLPLASGVADLGGWGGGYLGGLFALAAATVLALFGPVPGRRYARLAGLSTAGVLLAMLAAIAQSLAHDSRAIDLVYRLSLGQDQLQVRYGRGIWCAAVGVAAVTVALYLAGRHAPKPAVPGDGAGRATGDGALPPPEEPVRPRRRPRAADGDEDDLPTAEPFDLTVTPAPYTQLTEDHRDKRKKK